MVNCCLKRRSILELLVLVSNVPLFSIFLCFVMDIFSSSMLLSLFVTMSPADGMLQPAVARRRATHIESSAVYHLGVISILKARDEALFYSCRASLFSFFLLFPVRTHTTSIANHLLFNDWSVHDNEERAYLEINVAEASGKMGLNMAVKCRSGRPQRGSSWFFLTEDASR